MDTTLIDGAAVPDVDKPIATWLQRARPLPAADANSTPVWKIGVQNPARRVYREIIGCDNDEYWHTIAFLNKAGFAPVHADFNQHTDLDYVVQHDSW